VLIILRRFYCRQLAVLFKQVYYYAIYDYDVLTVYEAPTDDSDSQLVLFSTHFPLADNPQMSQYRFIAYMYRACFSEAGVGDNTVRLRGHWTVKTAQPAHRGGYTVSRCFGSFSRGERGRYGRF